MEGVRRIEIGETGRCPECGCVGPNPGYDPLTAEDIERHLKELSGTWTLDNGTSLVCDIQLTSRDEALRLINSISEVAESPAIAHHPDIALTGMTLRLRLHTHSAKGITAYDFRLAKALNPLLERLPLCAY